MVLLLINCSSNERRHILATCKRENCERQLLVVGLVVPIYLLDLAMTRIAFLPN